MWTDDEILFISDLHLDKSQPEISQQFLRFLEARAQNVRALYILGDLFEVWLGDDGNHPEFVDIFQALGDLSNKAELYFQHGNRDFLVGNTLAHKLNMTLLPEIHLITLGQQKIALTHGDLLCSDDTDYQDFRNKVRSSQWQQEFLAKPMAERLKIASDLREQSAQAMVSKSYEIMDVNQTTVADFFNQHSVSVLIHGHTHRPGIHHLGNDHTRIVLGDWQPAPSYLSWHDNQFKLYDDRI